MYINNSWTGTDLPHYAGGGGAMTHHSTDQDPPEYDGADPVAATEEEKSCPAKAWVLDNEWHLTITA